MATIEQIEEKSKMAEKEYGKAVKKLEDWEKGKYKGERLNELKEKLFNKEWEDEEEKGRWEEAVKKLEEEKESLEEKEGFWRGQIDEWGKELRKFGGGEGNEQIA